MGSIPSRRDVVTADICPTGWGAVWQKRTAQGLHINVLELWAVHLALKHFLPFLPGHTILNARAPSTRVHYKNSGKLFSRLCVERQADQVHCLIVVVLDFFYRFF